MAVPAGGEAHNDPNAADAVLAGQSHDVGPLAAGAQAENRPSGRLWTHGGRLNQKHVAYMLTAVISAAISLREARNAAGLSQRALAGAAGVAWSTVARIEKGHVDPTVGMLNRLLAAAGSDAVLTLARGRALPPASLASLVDAWTTGPNGVTLPDWTRLRAFIDDLALHPERTYGATLHMPSPSGSAAMDAILASLAEKACDDSHIPRPTWTRRVPPVPGGWALPGTPAMLERARAATPPQFARRGLALAEGALWRDPSTVGI